MYDITNSASIVANVISAQTGLEFIAVLLSLYPESLNHMHVVCVLEWQCPQKPEVSESLAARIMGGCEPPVMTAENLTQVFKWSRKHS